MFSVIATGWSVIFISYGPCVHFGSDFCYGMYTIALGGEAMQVVFFWFSLFLLFFLFLSFLCYSKKDPKKIKWPHEDKIHGTFF